MKVKSIEMLQSVLDSDLLHPELKAKLIDVVRNEVTTKPRKFNIWDYVSDDDIRPYFEGLYQDAEGYEVATNGHILIYRKHDVSADMAGKVVFKNGETMDSAERYPKWKVIVPKKSEMRNIVTIDFERVEQLYNDWKVAMVVNNHNLMGYVIIQGWKFKLPLFYDLCVAAREFGCDKLYIYHRGLGSACEQSRLAFGSLEEGVGGFIMSDIPMGEGWECEL